MGDNKLSSEREYGWYYDPITVVEPVFWKRRHEGTEPDEGGSLDQDRNLEADLATYGWLLHLAMNNVRDEKRKADEAKKRGNRRG